VPFEATNTDLLQNSMYKRREHEIKCERDGWTNREQLSAHRAKATVNEGGGGSYIRRCTWSAGKPQSS
jgi:hypothetical protein